MTETETPMTDNLIHLNESIQPKIDKKVPMADNVIHMTDNVTPTTNKKAPIRLTHYTLGLNMI